MSDPSAIRTIRPPVAGTRLTQTRMFTARAPPSGPDPGVLGIEQRRRTGNGDRHRVALAEELDEELRALLGVLRREIRHQQMLPDRRPGPGARDIGATTLRADDPLPVEGQDRLPPQPVTPDA